MHLHRRAVFNAVIAMTAYLGLGGLLLNSASAQAPTDEAAAMKYLRTLKDDAHRQVLEREAKREGRLVVYGALGVDRAQILTKMFNELYPDVKVDFIRLTLNELAEKLMLESRSNRVTADAVIVGSDWFGVINSAIAPYEPPTWGVFDPKSRYGGYEKGWAALDFEILPEAIAWRTDRVRPEEAPKTLDDIENPKWKGRLGTVTNLERVIDRYQAIYGETKGLAKIEALAANQNRLYPSIGALSSALAAGEIDVAWGVGAYRAIGLKKSGAPVDFVIQKPTFAIGDAVAVAKGAARPYAGALFVDFLTRAESQEKIDKSEAGRLFGNTKGNYALSLKDFPDLMVFPAVPPAKMRDLNRIVERLFVRK